MTMPMPFPRALGRTVRRAIGGGCFRKDRGASAVEFALVSPLLFTLLFGIIDYGLYFADALAVQQGVADAAREATLSVGSVSANWAGDGSCLPGLATIATNDLAKVVCKASSSIEPVGGGVLAVKAEIVGPDGTPTNLWAPGNRLRLCGVTRHAAVLPFVPMPSGGVLTSRVDMPIQPGGPTSALLLNAVAQDASIAGTTWSWC
jgi:TadE-like protein